MKGGCLCGAVRYEGELAGAALISVCHCSMCRRWGSGPLMSFHFDQGVTLVEAQGLRWYAASSVAERGFCQHCGSSLFWRQRGKDDNDWAVSIGTLDVTPKAAIEQHIFVDDQPDYYCFADKAPRLMGTG